MKLFKKFLLVAGAVGLIGSAGFAGKAIAAGPDSISATVAGDTATFSYSTLSANKLEVLVGSDTARTYDVEKGISSTQDISIKDAVNYNPSLFATKDQLTTIKGKLTLSGNTLAQTEEKTIPNGGLYRIDVAVNNDSWGTAEIKNYSDEMVFGYNGDTFILVAESNDPDSYVFSHWQDDSSNKNATRTVSVKSDKTKNSYVAVFKEKAPTPTPTDNPTLGVRITKTNGKIYSDTVKDTNKVAVINVGDKIELTPSSGATLYISDISYFTGSNPYTASKVTPSNSPVIFKAQSDDGESGDLKVTIEAAETAKVETSDFVEYVTNGYTIEFKASAVNKSTDINFAVKSDFKDYVDKIERTINTSDQNVTFKIKFKDKVDKGTNEKAIKLVATVDGREAFIDSDDKKEKEITIYSTPSMSYSTSDRTIKYNVPKKVNTGTESGVDDSNKDSTKTAISEIKGIKLQVLNGDSSLGNTSVAKDKGTSATLDAKTVESIVTNLSSKLSGDSVNLTFRGFPCDSDTKYNKKIYADSTTTAYRVVFTYTKADGTTAEEVVYGLEGQEIDITTISALKNATVEDANGKSVTRVKVSSSTSSNKYTAVLGAKTTADGTGLDKVPKTGQNNAMVFVMAAIVACAVAAGLYFYNKKAKNI